ncbi:protein phosphatase CheZ [Panacagrimonas sp.]|uniref:protein phosphatase CheZ n=1 Tax=Panacagrimonas sp. TaxID=2480088 RepID=UPI003B52FD08
MNAPLNATPGRAEQIKRLQELTALLQAGDDTAFEARFASFLQAREQGLFVSVAKLTRSLHDAVRELRFDDRLSSLAGREIPDACSRLDYVAKVTEEAAHKTLDLVEECQKLTQDIALATHDLAAACQRAHSYSGSPYSLSGLVVSVDETRSHIAESAVNLRERLSRLAQAQEYQDLAGQVIRKVTQLVKSVEGALIELLRASGGLGSGRTAEAPEGVLHGPAIDGVTPVAVSQDDADSLLAELGF